MLICIDYSPATTTLSFLSLEHVSEMLAFPADFGEHVKDTVAQNILMKFDFKQPSLVLHKRLWQKGRVQSSDLSAILPAV